MLLNYFRNVYDKDWVNIFHTFPSVVKVELYQQFCVHASSNASLYAVSVLFFMSALIIIAKHKVLLKFGIGNPYKNIFYFLFVLSVGPPLWASGQSSWLQIQMSRVRFPAPPDFLRSSGSGTGSTQPREDNRSYLKGQRLRSRKSKWTAVGIRCVDHATRSIC
jgi:hypothetical protein